MKTIRNQNNTQINTQNGTNTGSRKKAPSQEVEVLYQRIGNRWYAFSEVENEVFFTPIPDEMIQDRDGIASISNSDSKKVMRSGNS